MNLTGGDQSQGSERQGSKAHVMLLSRCLEAKAVEDFERNPAWIEALGEAPRRAIERLLQNGMLVEPELPHLIKYRYKISELQAMLKQRGLPISGRKDELIKRLVRADAEGMKRATDGLRLLICSAPGREIAEQYIAAEKAEKTELEDSVLGLIGQRLFEAASVVVATYEASRPLPRGLGIDWRNHDTARDVAILQAIWTSTPKILSRLDEDRVTALRVAASMDYLLGETSMRKRLPSELPGYRMDTATACRMFMFHATHKQNIENYRRSGVVRVVGISATQTSCEACRGIDGKRFNLEDVIDLPYEHCTHEMGCRCVVVPVVDLPGLS